MIARADSCRAQGWALQGATRPSADITHAHISFMVLRTHTHEPTHCLSAQATGVVTDDRPSARPPRRGLSVAQAAGLDGLVECE